MKLSVLNNFFKLHHIILGACKSANCTQQISIGTVDRDKRLNQIKVGNALHVECSKRHHPLFFSFFLSFSMEWRRGWIWASPSSSPRRSPHDSSVPLTISARSHPQISFTDNEAQLSSLPSGSTGPRVVSWPESPKPPSATPLSIKYTEQIFCTCISFLFRKAKRRITRALQV